MLAPLRGGESAPSCEAPSIGIGKFANDNCSRPLRGRNLFRHLPRVPLRFTLGYILAPLRGTATG